MSVDAEEFANRQDWPHPFRALLPTDAYFLLGIDYKQPLEVPLLAAKLVEELRSEVAPGHPLHDAECVAIGWNVDDENEIIFATNVPSHRIAFVHLTNARETSPDCPYIVGYGSFEDFAKSNEGKT